MSNNKKNSFTPEDNNNGKEGLDRRKFLTGSLVAAAAGLGALSPLLNAKEVPSFDEFFQKHYKELTDDDKQQVFARLEKEIEGKYGIGATVTDPQPIEDVEFAYVLNIGRCIGCRKCVYACMKENNLSRDPEIQYIRVLKLKKGSINLESSSHDYPANEAGSEDYYYMPVQCQQCRNPPCVKVCPVKATWKEKDGIIVIDYNWCIGCRYCMAACPYHARRFNFAIPRIAKEEINTNMGYLSNRPRYMGVTEKCTFCLHRTREGKFPACHDACPTGARKFGNIRDPKSEVRRIIEKERVYVLKQEIGTMPKFYYVFAK
jgi:molybdopterin-containing oxidoreductase family iron-sulfur binding subunit